MVRVSFLGRLGVNSSSPIFARGAFMSLGSESALLIVENGVDWESWADVLGRSGTAVHALVQIGGESNRVFTERAIAAIGDRAPFDALYLLCSGDRGDSVLRMRARLLRAAVRGASRGWPNSISVSGTPKSRAAIQAVLAAFEPGGTESNGFLRYVEPPAQHAA
ncbi:MAG: hypothetical protein R3A47_10365 [Polyangiales bacterium]